MKLAFKLFEACLNSTSQVFSKYLNWSIDEKQYVTDF